MASKHIIVWDPRKKAWPGSLLTDNHARALEQQGVVSLPCDPRMFMVCGAGGFAKREWGAGWPLDSGSSRFHAPLTIFATPEHRRLYWAARLMPDSTEDWQKKLSGKIQFATQVQQGTQVVANWSPDSPPTPPIESLGPPDAAGGWTLRGAGYVRVQHATMYGFAFYGVAAGARLIWAAASVSVD